MNYFVCIGTNLVECVLLYNSFTINLWTISQISLWCLYAHVFLPSSVLSQDLKGLTLFPLCVITFMHYTWISIKSHTCSHQSHHTPLYALLQPRHINKSNYIAIRDVFWMRLLHQTVWGLIGTSYRGNPLNDCGSNTIDFFGARRSANWQAKPMKHVSTLCIFNAFFPNLNHDMFF